MQNLNSIRVIIDYTLMSKCCQLQEALSDQRLNPGEPRWGTASEARDVDTTRHTKLAPSKK